MTTPVDTLVRALNSVLQSAEKYLEEIYALEESISLAYLERNECSGSFSVAYCGGSLPGASDAVSWAEIKKSRPYLPCNVQGECDENVSWRGRGCDLCRQRATFYIKSPMFCHSVDIRSDF